jgi:hypothetical protein
VDVEIRISRGDDSTEFAALREWLRGERALTGAVRPVRRRPGDSELGGAYDMLAVALGSGGAGVALARSLTAWLRTRRPDVAITVKSPSGEVTVDARKIKEDDVMPLLREVLGMGDESSAS